MALSNQELNALLEVLYHIKDLNEMSKLIEYDVYKLRTKLMTEMISQSSYELECG